MADRRKPGRPALDPDDPSVDINVRVPSKHYDHLYHAARQLRITVPELIRRRLRQDRRPADSADR